MKRVLALLLVFAGCQPKKPPLANEATFVGVWKQTADQVLSADTPVGPHKDRGGNWFTNRNHSDTYLTIEETPAGLKIRVDPISYTYPTVYGEGINIKDGRLEFGTPSEGIHTWYHLRLTNSDRIDGEKKASNNVFFAACFERMPAGFKIPYLPPLPH